MKNKAGILKAVAYSDIFEFPLTISEIHKFYVGVERKSQNEIKKDIFSLQQIDSKDVYFFLKGRDTIVLKRKLKEEESRQKEKKAKKIAKLLQIIPTIKLIALSGSLAQKNAGPEDDIDFFIVTRQNTVWISRFFINVLLILIGQKRKKNVRTASNKICPNMILSQSNLTIPMAARNIYTARELVQLRPLFSKDNMQEKLFSQNTWLTNFLPNTKISKVSKKIKDSKFEKIINLTDWLMFKIQKKYMQISRETVKKDIAKFHPRNTSQIILHLYSKKIESILTEYDDIKEENDLKYISN